MISGFEDFAQGFGRAVQSQSGQPLQCRQANLGSGTVQEMAQWLEYLTAEGDTALARERRANGRDKGLHVVGKVVAVLLELAKGIVRVHAEFLWTTPREVFHGQGDFGAGADRGSVLERRALQPLDQRLHEVGIKVRIFGEDFVRSVPTRLGQIPVEVDGQPVDFSRTWTYKGFMYSDVPNLASSFGYINASWTLRADLTEDRRQDDKRRALRDKCMAEWQKPGGLLDGSFA